MAKPGGFMEFRRKEPGYRDREERLKDYLPVENRLSDTDLNMQASRCMECGTPFCHGYGCPVGNVIPEINDLVTQGRWNEAADLLLSTNNFPEFTSRICPALCEASCVLNINDDPVTIRQIEAAVIEKAFESGHLKPRAPAARHAGRVAVIGSGPAGLAVADTLAKAGYGVTVYEKDAKAGGILRYGIPDFKLDKGILDRRIRLMEQEGVSFETGVTVGRDISFKLLRSRYDAICLTSGYREPRDLKVPGRELKGIHFAMAYLARQNMINGGEAVTRDTELDAKGRNVVVIGGGDTGSDCLGTALRQGAKSVLQMEIMPRPPEEPPESTPWPAWPNILRKSSSHEEGGKRLWSVNTVGFKGSAGRVAAVRCVEVDWKMEGGRAVSFKDRPGSEFEAPADLVLLALGFTGAGRDAFADELGLQKDERGSIRTDARCMTGTAGIFAAGDAARGQSLVVRAIADGRRAAAGIMSYLEEKRRGSEPGSRQHG